MFVGMGKGVGRHWPPLAMHAMDTHALLTLHIPSDIYLLSRCQRVKRYLGYSKNYL